MEFRCSVTPTNRTMAPGRVPSSLQTNLSLLAAEAKRERVLHTTPKEKKAVAHDERIHNSHLGLLRSELCTLDTAQFTRFVAMPTSLCHQLSRPPSGRELSQAVVLVTYRLSPSFPPDCGPTWHVLVFNESPSPRLTTYRLQLNVPVRLICSLGPQSGRQVCRH